MPKTSSRQSRYARYFIGTALVGTSLSQIALPVLADLLAAGEPISNTATATYQVVGPSGTTTITTESNTVTVTVAEIAGVTVTPSGLNNATNPGQSFQPNDQAEYIFDVENTGNDPTKFFLPTAASLNSAGALQISTDDGATFTGGGGTALSVSYQVYENGVLVGTLTPTQISIDNLAGGSDRAETISVEPGQVVKVSIQVQLDAGLTADDQIRLVFGNTNTQEAATLALDDNLQNEQRGISDGAVNDVYTSDNPNGSVIGEVNGAPVNGTREAEGHNTLTVNANTLKPFVKIEKGTGTFTASTPTDNDGLLGDSLEYTLAVSVANSLTEVGVNVPPGVTGVDDLKPTEISLNGNLVDRVLVSDVLPFEVGGAAQADLAGTPTAPTGWTVVYSISTPSTLSGASALWTTTAPTTLSDATQVGFIYSDSIANTTVAGSSLLKGSNVSGFTFEVTFADADFAGDTIVRGIAEVHGTDANDDPVKDQSGDPTHNNDDNGDGVTDAGFASDPDGTLNTDDPGGNTGTGLAGENTVYEKVDSGDIRNGTVDGNTSSGTLYPSAQGPTDINDDFTNVNSPITATTVPAVTFNNSLENVGTNPDRFCLTVDAYNDLPAGTTTITIEQQQVSGSVRVVYTVAKSSATAAATVSIVNQDGTSNPLYLLIAAGEEQRYTVNVKLPDDAPRVVGYDVPIVAYKDDSNTGITNLCAQGIDKANDPYNITIDRVYTGFVELTKKVQVLDASGNPVSGPRGLMDTDTKSIAPGERMKYLVEYLNISEEPPSTATPVSANPQSQNVILNAQSFTIVEDGTASGNNWGLDLDGDNAMDTVHVDDTALHTPPSGGTVTNIAFVTGTSTFTEGDGDETAGLVTDVNVSKYTTLLAGNLEPQGAGSFTFQRKFEPTNP